MSTQVRIPFHRRIAAATAVAAALLAGACAGEEAPETETGGEEPAAEAVEPSVSILSPADGATVSGDSVTVRLAAEDVEITPATVRREGTGHHHLFLDEDPTAAGDTIPDGTPGIIHLGRGQTEFTFTGVEPGAHRLIAVVADWNHVPLEPAVRDTVRFTVPE